MDLGLDKLIEMIEQRFGKIAATAVLFAITAGAFAWGIHALFAYLVWPAVTHGPTVWNYIRSVTPATLFLVIASIIYPVLPGVLIYLVVMAIVRKTTLRRFDEHIAAQKDLIDQRIIELQEERRQIEAKSLPVSAPPSPVLLDSPQRT